MFCLLEASSKIPIQNVAFQKLKINSSICIKWIWLPVWISWYLNTVSSTAIAVNSSENTCRWNMYIARNTEKNIYLSLKITVISGNTYFFRLIKGLWISRELFVTSILGFIFKVNSVLTCSMITDIYMVWAMGPSCRKWIHTDQK